VSHGRGEDSEPLRVLFAIKNLVRVPREGARAVEPLTLTLYLK
jgi:hypothetical protein